MLGYIYTLLIIAFAWGVWQSSEGNRPLRAVGGLIVAYGIISLIWPLTPMHLRGAETSTTDTLHIVLAAMTVLLMILMIGFGARAFGKAFRLYSIVTLVILLVFGTLTGLDGPRIAANLPTPWAGVWERINIGIFLLWIVVLAINVWRPEKEAARH